ncbi:MAG: hypothetical protein HY900_14540, partial [Deltaproteobacteria bacterium]|nr:hypothetical protein [Deltaproteobacteria bacterium]
FCAAWVNNVAMAWGATRLDIECSEVSFAEAVRGTTSRLFGQIAPVLTSYYGRPPAIAAKEYGEAPEFGPCAESLFRPIEQIPIGGGEAKALGVNIGQTATKCVDCDVGGRILARRSFGTWVSNPDRDFTILTKEVQCARDGLLAETGNGHRLDAVGVALGGIVTGGRVLPGAGLTLHRTPAEVAQLGELASVLGVRFGAKAAVVQDVAAKAFALRAAARRERTLLLDVGTSTGGVTFGEDGEACDLLHQVGRVCVDLGPKAASRDDRAAIGVVSKYLSAAGWRRACAVCGIDPALEADVLAGDGAADEVALGCARREFLGYLECTVETLRLLYPFDRVVLTGGVVAGALGDYLLAESRDRRWVERGLPDVTRSTESVFEGARGAALLALALE